MIKLIIFLVLFLIVISAFSVSLGFFINGFESLTTIFTTFADNFFSIIENIFNSLFNSPILSLFMFIGLVFICLRYLISLIGGDKDA